MNLTTRTLLLALVIWFPIGCTSTDVTTSMHDDTSVRVVEASCGTCQFGMVGDTCALAIRMDGEAMWVDGSGIDDHGDAHGADGLCNAIRAARVQGEVIDGRFRATSFSLLPD